MFHKRYHIIIKQCSDFRKYSRSESKFVAPKKPFGVAGDFDITGTNVALSIYDKFSNRFDEKFSSRFDEKLIIHKNYVLLVLKWLQDP